MPPQSTLLSLWKNEFSKEDPANYDFTGTGDKHSRHYSILDTSLKQYDVEVFLTVGRFRPQGSYRHTGTQCGCNAICTQQLPGFT